MLEYKKVNLEFAESSRGYDIYIGHGLLSEVDQLIDLDSYSQVFVLSDNNVAPIYSGKLPGEFKLITAPAGEAAKSVDTVKLVWEELLKYNADRKSLLINLGGGVIGDLGGFVASTYMRGIDFVNVPTTILAAADANIGGKTGFNFAGLKNLVGTFAQPKAVFADTDTFKTLEKRTFNEGFAEIIKHAAVFDENYFAELERMLPNPSSEQLINILQKSGQLKADIVMADEKESGKRKLLNFGHTIGHAIESLSHERGDALLHGEAIGIGMVAEARLGELAGLTEPGTANRMQDLLSRAGLPNELPGWITTEALLAKVAYDKKNTDREINWVVLRKIGAAEFDVRIPDAKLLKLLDQ